MSNNVPITGGVGTDIATEQVTDTNEHIQLFKVAVSETGSRELVPASSDGLEVQAKAVVNDSPVSFETGSVQRLSLTTQGRLRVSMVEADTTQVWQHTFTSPWSTDNPWELESPYV